MIYILYYTEGGNTKRVAKILGEKIEKVTTSHIHSFDVAAIKEEDTLILGCAAYGDEELSRDMLSFIDKLDYKVKGRTLGLFGTYGGGNGLWMDLWVQRMKDLGADLISSGLRVHRDEIEDFSYDEYISLFNR